MGPRTDELCHRLEESIALLERVGESHWQQFLQVSLGRVKKSDYSGIDHLHSAFGGMGSFTDLVISHMNNHSVSRSEEHEINERLSHLKGELYRLVQEIRQVAEIRKA